jgi:hypothetical protein
MPKAKGGGDMKSDHRSRPETGDSVPTLKDQGIDKRDAAKWQSIASIPPKDFERHLEEPPVFAERSFSFETDSRVYA